jgi:hypothetical protein
LEDRKGKERKEKIGTNKRTYRKSDKLKRLKEIDRKQKELLKQKGKRFTERNQKTKDGNQ